jgi:hypothetical protein
MFLTIAILLLCSNLLALTQDEAKKYDELEGLAFIKALSADKKFQAVIKEFPNVSKRTEDKEELNYHLAFAHFSLKEYKEAFTLLQKVESGVQTSNFYILKARAAHALKLYSNCSESFLKVKKNLIVGQDWSLYANCLEGSDNTKYLIEVFLNNENEDEDFFLAGQKVFLKNSLFQTARDRRNNFYEKCRTIKTYLDLWSILQEYKVAEPQAIEVAHSCHTEALEITSLLVKELFSQQKFHSIAFLFETMAYKNQEFLKHAAEFYKVAGRPTIADYFFSIGDENSFLLSRSAKFLVSENYSGLIAIPFKKEIVDENKDLAYAISYSYFKFFQLADAKIINSRSITPNSRDQILKNLIQKCLELDWRCRP